MNPVLIGALIGGLAGVATTLLHGWKTVWTTIKRWAVTTVDVSDQDEAFYWIQTWLARHEYSQRARLLTASTKKGLGYGDGPVSKASSVPQVMFTPAPGLHVLRYHGRVLFLHRVRQESTQMTDLRAYREHFSLTIVHRDRVLLRSLFHEARDLSIDVSDVRLSIWAPSDYREWRNVARRPQRPASSVILRQGLMEDLLDDLQTFLTSATWYAEAGVPHRRGLLLEGPPGNGKTSLVLALASEIGYDVATIGLTSPNINDETFRQLTSTLPERCILLLEDIDAAFHGRESQSTSLNKLTFAGMLNILDGVASSEGRILVMTTNHPDQLDAALVRPGRVDRRIFIDNADRTQARRLFLRFFPDACSSADMFAAAGAGSSMATLQEHLLTHRDDAEAAANLDGQRRPFSMVDAV